MDSSQPDEHLSRSVVLRYSSHPSLISPLLSVQGTNTSHFTSSNQLFLAYPPIDFWRFEVVYSFPTVTSSSALNFVINPPPSNGSCSIGPSNGTTTTQFTVDCPDWLDEDGIKDYSLYRTLTPDRWRRTMPDFSFSSLVSGVFRTNADRLFIRVHLSSSAAQRQ